MNTKDIADLFFHNFGKALFTTKVMGFNEPTDLAFKDYIPKITKEIINDLNKFYIYLIDKNDKQVFLEKILPIVVLQCQ
jgi:hypothetical protein